MTTTEQMTPGQMRQLLNAVGSTIPADFTKAEVRRILKGPAMRRHLETFWDSMRADEDRGLYVRLPKGDFVEYIYEQQIAFDYTIVDDWLDRKNEQLLRSMLEPFLLNDKCTRHGVWIEKLWFKQQSPVAIHRWLKQNGYRSADFRELVAYSMINRPSNGGENRHKIIAADGCANFDHVGGMGSWYDEDEHRLEFYKMEGAGSDGYNRDDWNAAGILAVKL